MAMGHDFRSKIKAEQDYPSLSANLPHWVTQQAGQFPFDYDIDWNSIGGTTGNSNSVTLKIRIRAAYLHDAIPYILGFGTRNSTTIPPAAGKSALLRTLPMQFPADRNLTTVQTIWGYRATSLTWVLEGATGEHGSSWTSQLWMPPIGTYDSTDAIDPKTRKLTDSTPFGNPPRSPDEPFARYEWAVLSVTFSHVPYDIDTDTNVAGSAEGERDRYTWGTFSSGYEYNTMPPGVLYWGHTSTFNADQPVGNAASGGLIVSTGSVSVTWFRVPGAEVSGGLDAIKDTLDQIELYLGKVNASSFRLPVFKSYRTYPAQTLMLVPQSTQPVMKLGPTGLPEADITFNFMYRAAGWNKLMTPQNTSPPSFQPVVIGQGGSPPYPLDTTVDANGFANLFLG